MDESIKDIYAFLLKFGGRVIRFEKWTGSKYMVIIERDPNLVDIDSSSKYAKTFRYNLLLGEQK